MKTTSKIGPPPIALARTNREDNILIQRGWYTDEAHTALDIFRFAVFFSIILSRYPPPFHAKLFILDLDLGGEKN